MQTKGAHFADKVCLKMQTKFCRQTLSRHVPPECRQRLSKMQTRALNFSRNCRQIMQTKFVYPPDGDAYILGCLQGFVCRVCLHFRQIMQTKFVYIQRSAKLSAEMTNSTCCMQRTARAGLMMVTPHRLSSLQDTHILCGTWEVYINYMFDLQPRSESHCGRAGTRSFDR